MFPVRAIFWVILVAAFVPKDFSAPIDGAFAQEATRMASQLRDSGAGENLAHVADDACVDRENTCEVVGEVAQIAGFMMNMAAHTAEDLFASNATEDAELTAEQLVAQLASETR